MVWLCLTQIINHEAIISKRPVKTLIIIQLKILRTEGLSLLKPNANPYNDGAFIKSPDKRISGKKFYDCVLQNKWY